MKKILSLLLALTLVFGVCTALTSCGEKDTYTVGILQLAPHPALDAATNGFMQALKDELGEDKVKFDLQNAAGDTATCATIANTFVSKNYDLVMGNATAALQALAASTTKIPILGTSITEYGVALDIDNFNGTVGGNISGTSDLAPLSEQANMVVELFPEAQNVGIIYCSAEANSIYQVNVVKAELEAKGLTVTTYSFSDSNDISAVTTLAASASDVIYIPTDNTAASCTETIGNIVREAGVPVIAGEEGICAGCGVATLSISYYALGYQTGVMAAKILKGEAKISEMAIAYDPTPVKKYNADMWAALDLGAAPAGYTAIETAD